MTNLYGIGPSQNYSYPVPAPALPVSGNPGSRPIDQRSPAAYSAASLSDPDSIRLLLRLLDLYSYNKSLKESSGLQSATRDLIDQRGENAAAEALLARINNDLTAQGAVCQLLGLAPPRPVTVEDFSDTLLNKPLERSDLKQALAKAEKLQFGELKKDVRDLLVVLDLISGKQALGTLLPSNLPGLQQTFYSPTGLGPTLRQLYAALTQNDLAYLASVYGLGNDVTLKALLAKALPLPAEESDLAEAFCKLDPQSCQPAAGEKSDKPAEPAKEVKNPHAIIFDGGLRLRFQDDKSTKDQMRTDRLRYKAVAGATVAIVPDLLKAKVGLIAGAADKPRSPNNTDQLEMPLPRINLAYAELAPKWDGGEVRLAGGRLAMPLWLSCDTVFDRDISWDGFAAGLSLDADENFAFYLNGGFLPLLGGSSTSKGSYLYPVQGGLDIKSESVDLKAGIGYLGFSGIKSNAALAYRSSPATNDTTAVPAAKAGDPAVNVYNYNYDAVIFDYQIIFKFQGGVALSHYGEFLRASSTPSDANKAYTFGGILSLLDKQLTINYSYRRLEREATLDIFPDDDFYGGGSTDASGHKLKVNALYYKDKAFTAGSSFSFFRSDRINSAASNLKTTVMIDFLEVGF